MSSALAYFDLLELGVRMSDIVDGFARTEMHLFAYAGCLLSLYEGQPTADWGYEFISTESGLPFTQAIDEAIESALSVGHLVFENSLLVVTEDGRSELAELHKLDEFSRRTKYLNGAADVLLVLNPGNVREAFNYDPTISYLRSANRTDWLLTSQAVDRIYSNFQQLRQALAHDAYDLSVPLITWLKYLLHQGRFNSHVVATKS